MTASLPCNPKLVTVMRFSKNLSLFCSVLFLDEFSCPIFFLSFIVQYFGTVRTFNFVKTMKKTEYFFYDLNRIIEEISVATCSRLLILLARNKTYSKDIMCHLQAIFQLNKIQAREIFYIKCDCFLSSCRPFDRNHEPKESEFLLPLNIYF